MDGKNSRQGLYSGKTMVIGFTSWLMDFSGYLKTIIRDIISKN